MEQDLNVKKEKVLNLCAVQITKVMVMVVMILVKVMVGFIVMMVMRGFPAGSDGKESACNAGDLGSIPGSDRSPGDGNGYPLQYSCPENSMDRGDLCAIVHGVSKNGTGLTLSLSHNVEEEREKKTCICAYDWPYPSRCAVSKLECAFWP